MNRTPSVRRSSLERENPRWIYTKADTFFVVILPVTLGLLTLRHFSLPCKDVHFVLDHDHYVFDYPVIRTANSIVVQKHVEAHRPGNGTDAYPSCD